MPQFIRARYNGQVFVPEEPVDIREGELGILVFTPLHTSSAVSDEQEGALRRLMSTGVEGTHIPIDALRREHLYEE